MHSDSRRNDSASSEPKNPTSIPALESVPLALTLFAFWAVLSGKFDVLHLGLGAVSAVAVAVVTMRIYALEPWIGPRGRHPFAAFPWVRAARYLPWLFWQIAVASFQVAAIVLRPKMPIEPRMFRFHYPLPDTLARATLANSITLTPGTVTIDVLGDEYLVHALTNESAKALEEDSPSDMKSRVEAVFTR